MKEKIMLVFLDNKADFATAAIRLHKKVFFFNFCPEFFSEFVRSRRRRRSWRDSNPDLATARPIPRCRASCRKSSRGPSAFLWPVESRCSSGRAETATSTTSPTSPVTPMADAADDEWRDRKATLTTTNSFWKRIEFSFYLASFDSS